MIQQVNFKFNNYEEFREFILNELPNFMPKEYMKSRVMISDTIKINGRDREIISFVRHSLKLLYSDSDIMSLGYASDIILSAKAKAYPIIKNFDCSRFNFINITSF